MKPLNEAGLFGKISNPQPQVYDKGVLDPSTESDPALTLKFFFDLRDRKNVPIVDDLFEMFELKYIAFAVYHKYQLLPAGWHKALKKLSKKEPEALKWLNFKTMVWLVENTSNFPPIMKNPAFSTQGDVLDKIVDEFVQNEKEYFLKIDTMVSFYVSEIVAIVSNKIGNHAKESLGLSQEEVDYVFGPLLKVHEAVKVFLVMLETVGMVRAPTKTPEGRPGQLAKLFTEAGPGLTAAYAPYNATYMEAKNILMKDIKTPSKPQEATESSLRNMNFSEIWTEIAQSKAPLKTMAIDAVLILPIRRLPNYLLFISRLIKNAKDRLPACIPYLEQAAEDIQRHTEQINEAAGGNSST